VTPPDLVVAPATGDDADAAARLILELPGGLTDIFGPGDVALRVARASFVAERSVLGFRHALVARLAGEAVGLVVRVRGAEWPSLRVRTGLTILRAAGPARVFVVVRRGRRQDALIPPVAPDRLYVPALAVAPAHRGQGVGTELLRAVLAEAARGPGIRAVALDVAADNAGAVALYRRHGFEVVEERRVRPAPWLAHPASLRMERPAAS
jgi:ribosomal protein S18 acetylase RimI-like enzyme